MKKFSQNTFPIIVIEDYNLRGYVIYSSILQTVLNYKSAKKRVIVSTKLNEINKEIFKSKICL